MTIFFKNILLALCISLCLLKKILIFQTSNQTQKKYNKQLDTREIWAIRHKNDRMAEAAKGSMWGNPDISNCIKLLSLLYKEGNGNPLQCSCLESPRDGGAWWAAVYGVAQSWTRLKQPSSSSSSSNWILLTKTALRKVMDSIFRVID